MKIHFSKTPLVFGLAGVLLLLSGMAIPCLMKKSVNSPEYWDCFQYWQGGICRSLALLGGVILLSSLFALLFRKTIRENCGWKTLLLSAAISATGSAGLYCLAAWGFILGLGETQHYPLEFAGSILIGGFCALAFLGFLALYWRERKKQFSPKGILIDLSLALLLFIPFLSICIWLKYLLEGIF